MTVHLDITDVCRFCLTPCHLYDCASWYYWCAQILIDATPFVWLCILILLMCTDFHSKWFPLQGLLEYCVRMLKKPPFVFCDYHGHSRRKNVFLYGCSNSDSWNETDHAVPDNPADYLVSVTKWIEGFGAVLLVALEWWRSAIQWTEFTKDFIHKWLVTA
jgi:hypothetical protein